MYDPESYEIPDCDAKLSMSLDEIIRRDGIRKPGPSSVKSRYSYRSNRSTFSNRSNKSHRSTYSNKSRHSTYSNKSRHSTYSNKSRHSTYSNKSHQSTYSNGSNRLQSFGQEYGNNFSLQSNFIEQRGNRTNGIKYRYMGRSSMYNNNTRVPLMYYRNSVRNAVRCLTNRVTKQKRSRIMPLMSCVPFNYGPQYFNRVPSDLTVEVDNASFNNQYRLTKKSLAKFNLRNHNFYRTRSVGNYPHKRHTVRGRLNKFLQNEIFILQQKVRQSSNNLNEDYSSMEFSPVPHVSGVTTNDRFSSYD